MSYGEKRNRSQNSATTNSNTNSFREVSNNQDFTQAGIGWRNESDIPKYWSSINTNSNGPSADNGRGYSIDSGYCEWSPGNKIDVGGSGYPGNIPQGLNVGAASRYCYQWQRVGGVVTGSGRVQLGVNGGTDGTSATWLQYGRDNDSDDNGALYTSFDTGEQDRDSGNFTVGTIPLPVYYQTNINNTTGQTINPRVESRADLVGSPLDSTNATGLRGVKNTMISGNSTSTDRWVGGAGTVVGGYWNTIGDAIGGQHYSLFYPDGTYAGRAKPPILNVSGVIHFSDNQLDGEAMAPNSQARYMNIIVKAPSTPNQVQGAYPAANLMNFGGSLSPVSPGPYSYDQYRYILPPMFHFTFSYTLGGYPTATNTTIS